MGKETDNLIHLANDVVRTQPGREMDMLLTTGERKSRWRCCAWRWPTCGVEASSFTGSQVGIITDTSTARPRSSRSRAIGSGPRSPTGKVCVVAGFQGVSTDKEITTLGRGGSDTTAVALAAALGADAARSTPT